MYFDVQCIASPNVAEERIATASGPTMPMSWRSAKQQPEVGAVQHESGPLEEPDEGIEVDEGVGSIERGR